jgi:hypothetical protein
VTPPTVSGVMIFLDGAEFIDEAIRSVVDQSGFDDWELILVDDGSTDGSTEIATRWAASDPDRIHYVDHPGHANLGMSASRNVGVGAARGRYVGFLDCDDVWLPCMMAHCSRVLAGHPQADVVIGGTWRWYGWSGSTQDARREHQMELPGTPHRETIEPPALFRGIYHTPDGWRVPAMCSVLIARDALERIGGFDGTFRGLYEDQVLYTKLALNLRAVIDPRPIALYRQHPASECERSITAGTWQRLGPSQPILRFLRWMLEYVEVETGSDSPETAIARRNLEHYEHWVEPAPVEQTSWLRRNVPAPIRRLVRWTRRLLSRRADTSVVGVWSEQFLRAAVAAMRGSILAVTSAGRGRELWVDEVPVDSIPPGAFLRSQSWATARAGATRFDHVVVPLRAAPALPTDQLLAEVAALLHVGGTAVLVLPGAVIDGDRVTSLSPNVRVTVETFGNAITANAVVGGLPPDSGLGVALDRHDPAVPVVAAITVERGA